MSSLGVGGQLRSKFHENPGGKIGVQPFQRTIALSGCERSFAFAAGKRRSGESMMAGAFRASPIKDLHRNNSALAMLVRF